MCIKFMNPSDEFEMIPLVPEYDPCDKFPAPVTLLACAQAKDKSRMLVVFYGRSEVGNVELKNGTLKGGRLLSLREGWNTSEGVRRAVRELMLQLGFNEAAWLKAKNKKFYHLSVGVKEA